MNHSGAYPDSLSPATSPFIEKQVICPICGAPSSQRRLKVRVYQEQDREVDLRPATIVWKEPGLTRQHPDLYYMWACPRCHFAAGHPLFENPCQTTELSLGHFRQALEEGRDNTPGARALLKALYPGPEDPSRPRGFMDALRIFFMGIYNLELIPQVVKRDAIDLGRYHLRLAWLYREMAARPQLAAKALPLAGKLAQKLAAQWKEAPGDEVRARELACRFYEVYLDASGLVGGGEDVVTIGMLITRIQLGGRMINPARRTWSRTQAMLVSLDVKAKDLRAKLREMENKKRGGKLDPEELLSLQSAISKTEEEASTLETAVRRLKNKAQELSGLLYDRVQAFQAEHRAMAEKIMKKAGPLPDDRMRAALLDGGVDETVVDILLPEKEEKKKGRFKFLGIFKKQ